MIEAVITDEIDGVAEHDFLRRLHAAVPGVEGEHHPLARALRNIGAIRCHPRPDCDVYAWVIPKRAGFVTIEPHIAELVAAIVACDDVAVAAWLTREGYI